MLKCPSLTITPDVALMSKLPIMDALQGHPLYGHLAGQRHIDLKCLHAFLKINEAKNKVSLKKLKPVRKMFWEDNKKSSNRTRDIMEAKGGTRLNKREIPHTHTHARTHSSCIGIRWRETGGLSGAQLNAVIRFEIQPYWLERWVWRRRFDRACCCPGRGDYTSALTQTMTDRVARGSGSRRG